MSGSYERFPGRPPAPARAGGRDFDPYEDSVTGPPTGPASRAPSYPAPQSLAPGDSRRAPQTTQTQQSQPSLDEGTRDMYAPSREQDKGRRMKVMAPVVPPGSVTGRSLTLVIAIMCFLACLTAGAVWLIKESSDAWLRDIASEVTVQVEPKEKADVDKSVKDVVAFLEKQPGIRTVRALSLEDSSSLLEPWLGSSDALKTLPVPRLIAIEIDRIQPPDLEEVSAGLTKQFKGVSLDDHRRWQQQIRAVTRSFALGGLAILGLVAAATTAIIVSATKSAMASNREIVEVLHFVGATDKFIAREFEKHFLRLGIKAGIVGAVSAMLVFLGMPVITELLGGGNISSVEMQRMIGTGALDASGYVLLGLVVVIIAALCMITSRMGVYRILNHKH
jgi:cell division transport system permease protein